MAFLSDDQLFDLGFKSVGKNVLISDKASIYNANNIEIGENTRIDDFCILSAGTGGIEIGRNVHIACYVSIIGKGKVKIDDFAGISSKSAIYSSNDDYSGNFMTGPTLPEKFINVSHKEVNIEKHVIIGVNTVVLPGVTIKKGAAIGAFSLVNKDCEALKIYAGVPIKLIKERKSNFLSLEVEYLNQINP